MVQARVTTPGRSRRGGPARPPAAAPDCPGRTPLGRLAQAQESVVADVDEVARRERLPGLALVAEQVGEQLHRLRRLVVAGRVPGQVGQAESVVADRAHPDARLALDLVLG